MKKRFTLAALAAITTLLVPASARADTSSVHGGNWADDGDNFQTGVIYPTGITSSTTTTEAAAEADVIASDDMSVGINFVRIGINPATISDNWTVFQAYVNELVADGMNVDLGFWTTSHSVGTVTNFNGWKAMWQTVDGVYKNNDSVFYEPINEPHGYASESALSSTVYQPFLGFVSKRHDHIIVDGENTADSVINVGGDANLTSCLLGIHTYAGWWGIPTTESGWSTALYDRVNPYQDRTIMTEMGAPATTGLDYGVSSTNVNICFIRGICAEVNSLGLGMVYWPSHRANDTFRLFNSPGDGVTNPSLIDRLQSGWGFFSSLASLEVADFNVVGTTAYSTFRPAGSIWEIQSGGGGQFGIAGDIAVPADYAGTGKAQMAVWRQSNGEYWYIDGGATTQFGLAGDIPVPGDYLGTGKAQLAVWRPAGGNWYINGGTTTQFGLNGDIPVPGYYNGDGHLDMAVYRPSTKTWYINGGATVQWGLAGDIPVPGDYNGSGTTQIAVFRPSTRQWLVYQGATITYGLVGDVPVPGDYNSSGTTQAAVWRPSNNTWYVNGVGSTTWGATNDVPLPLPYAIRHYCLGYSQ